MLSRSATRLAARGAVRRSKSSILRCRRAPETTPVRSSSRGSDAGRIRSRLATRPRARPDRRRLQPVVRSGRETRGTRDRERRVATVNQTIRARPRSRCDLRSDRSCCRDTRHVRRARSWSPCHARARRDASAPATRMSDRASASVPAQVVMVMVMVAATSAVDSSTRRGSTRRTARLDHTTRYYRTHESRDRGGDQR